MNKLKAIIAVLGVCVILSACSENGGDRSESFSSGSVAGVENIECFSVGQIMLQINSSYEGIQRLEEALAILGYDPGVVDSQWDSASTSALNAFQVVHQRKLTANADNETEALIYSKFLRPSGSFIYLTNSGVIASVKKNRLALAMGDNVAELILTPATRIIDNQSTPTDIDELKNGGCVTVVSTVDNEALVIMPSRGAFTIE